MGVKHFFLLAFIFCTYLQSSIQAQQVIVNESSTVQSMRAHYKSYYGQYPEIRAHRIQVTSTTDRRQMDATLRKLDQKHPGIFVDWKHTAPYYRVIVGAYLTRWDAEVALYDFRKEFPGSVIIYDNIPKEQFLNTK